jgi:tripartite-type tricarboxylate transporter receptor subunit TctC
VPYRGTAQSTLDLLEGRVEMQFGTIPPTLTHIRAGKLRALAVTGAARNPTLPEVPTLAESGLEGYECSLWQAIVAPAAVSPAIVARLNREVGAVLADPQVRATFAKNGIEAEASSPAALGARIRADLLKWREVIANAGIRAN